MLHVDWPRRYKLMRMHTACHLLSVVCPFPITGAAVGEDESRVDFDLPDPTYTKEFVTEKLMERVNANDAVAIRWISDEEFLANPDIVKSKNVRPPLGSVAYASFLLVKTEWWIRNLAAARTFPRRRKWVKSTSARSKRRARKTAVSAFVSAPCRNPES